MTNVSSSTIIAYGISEDIRVGPVLTGSDRQNEIWRILLGVGPKKFALVNRDTDRVVMVQSSINVSFLRMWVPEGFEERRGGRSRSSTARNWSGILMCTKLCANSRFPDFRIVRRVIRTNQFIVHCDTISLRGRDCLLYTSPSPRDGLLPRMPSSA